MELEFSGRIFKNSSNIKFHENPSVEAELFHAEGQTGRHDEADSLFSTILRTRLQTRLAAVSAFSGCLFLWPIHNIYGNSAPVSFCLTLLLSASSNNRVV